MGRAVAGGGDMSGGGGHKFLGRGPAALLGRLVLRLVGENVPPVQEYCSNGGRCDQEKEDASGDSGRDDGGRREPVPCRT